MQILSFFQGKPDVRMAFVQFVLSFLVSGDGSTIGHVLEMKGNMFCVFNVFCFIQYHFVLNDVWMTLMFCLCQNSCQRSSALV